MKPLKRTLKTMMLLTLLILSIILTACNKQNSNINEFIQDSELKRIVSESLLKFASPSKNSIKAVFEFHEIVGKEVKKDILSVYVIGYVMGVYGDNKRFGGEFPCRIQIQKVENVYKVVDYKDALASMDVYDFMPKKYAKDILNYDTTNLSKNVDRQTEDWLKSNKSN